MRSVNLFGFNLLVNSVVMTAGTILFVFGMPDNASAKGKICRENLLLPRRKKCGGKPEPRVHLARSWMRPQPPRFLDLMKKTKHENNLFLILIFKPIKKPPRL